MFHGTAVCVSTEGENILELTGSPVSSMWQNGGLSHCVQLANPDIGEALSWNF